MTQTELILIRHGKARSNLATPDQRVDGDSNLLPEGRSQVYNLVHRLARIATAQTLYSSPYERTRQTAEIIAGRLNLEVVVDQRLQEIQKGAWHDRLVSDVIELEAAVDPDDKPWFRPPGGGENWPDVADRMAKFIEEKRLAGARQIIAISHDHPIRMGIGRLLGEPVETWEDRPIDFASITRLVHDKRWRLVGSEY